MYTRQDVVKNYYTQLSEAKKKKGRKKERSFFFYRFNIGLKFYRHISSTHMISIHPNCIPLNSKYVH